jgi:hypothetical protein
MCVGEVKERFALSLFLLGFKRIPKKNQLTLIKSSKATPFLGETLRIAIRHFTIFQHRASRCSDQVARSAVVLLSATPNILLSERFN